MLVPCRGPELNNNGPSYSLGCLIVLSPQWDCNGRDFPKRLTHNLFSTRLVSHLALLHNKESGSETRSEGRSRSASPNAICS